MINIYIRDYNSNYYIFILFIFLRILLQNIFYIFILLILLLNNYKCVEYVLVNFINIWISNLVMDNIIQITIPIM